MTRVNFYLLGREDEGARELFACRLAEKLLREGTRVQLATDDEESARALDNLLWQFRPDSFVPHALAGSAAADNTDILITWQAPLPVPVVLNLRSTPLTNPEAFETIAEIILAGDAARADGRQRWAHYKQASCELQHHPIP
jgi:DNA polymerase-3 subunit chi